MKHKVFLSFKFTFRILFLTIILFIGLIVIAFMKYNLPKHFMIELTFYGLIVLNVLWVLVFYTLYQTRIAIDENELYAPFHIWYPNFVYEKDTISFVKTILLKDIESITKQEVYSEPDKKKIKVLVVSIRDKYDLCISLDAYDNDDVLEIADMIQNNISKIS